MKFSAKEVVKRRRSTCQSKRKTFFANGDSLRISLTLLKIAQNTKDQISMVSLDRAAKKMIMPGLTG